MLNVTPLIDKEKHWVRGYQVEVAQQEVMGLWHHSISPEKYRSTLALAGQETNFAADGEKSIKQVAEPKQIKSAYKENKWNDLTVIARGPKLVQIITWLRTCTPEFQGRVRDYSGAAFTPGTNDRGGSTALRTNGDMAPLSCFANAIALGG